MITDNQLLKILHEITNFDDETRFYEKQQLPGGLMAGSTALVAETLLSQS